MGIVLTPRDRTVLFALWKLHFVTLRQVHRIAFGRLDRSTVNNRRDHLASGVPDAVEKAMTPFGGRSWQQDGNPSGKEQTEANWQGSGSAAAEALPRSAASEDSARPVCTPGGDAWGRLGRQGSIWRRGMAGAGLLAHIAVSKYADHIPLLRSKETALAALKTWMNPTPFKDHAPP